MSERCFPNRRFVGKIQHQVYNQSDNRGQKESDHAEPLPVSHPGENTLHRRHDHGAIHFKHLTCLPSALLLSLPHPSTITTLFFLVLTNKTPSQTAKMKVHGGWVETRERWVEARESHVNQHDSDRQMCFNTRYNY